MEELRLLLMLLIANASPVGLRMWLGDRLRTPVDGGLTLHDGQPLFGSSKTLAGLGASILASTLSAPLLGLHPGIGALIGACAMLGDLMTSFIKRRLCLVSSSPAPVLDQAAEALLPLLACKALLPLSWTQVAVLTTLFIGADLLISQVLYRLGIGEHPY